MTTTTFSAGTLQVAVTLNGATLASSRALVSVQSYSQVIRDAFFATLAPLPSFAEFIKRRSKQLPIQQPLLPYLGVYIVGEEMGPDGDVNAGDIRFLHRLRIGFQIIIENNDPVASELQLDGGFWAIMNGLWTNAGLTNMINSSMPDNTRIEGIERGTRKHSWGTIGRNEKPIGELEYIATVRYRSEWFPSGFPDLRRIHTEAVPLADDGTVPPSDEVQRIILEYEFPSSTPSVQQGGRAHERSNKRDAPADEGAGGAGRAAARPDPAGASRPGPAAR